MLVYIQTQVLGPDKGYGKFLVLYWDIAEDRQKEHYVPNREAANRLKSEMFTKSAWNNHTFISEYNGEECLIEWRSYTPSTNYQINSASHQPNEPEEFEFIVHLPGGVTIGMDGHNVKDGTRILKEYLEYVEGENAE